MPYLIGVHTSLSEVIPQFLVWIFWVCTHKCAICLLFHVWQRVRGRALEEVVILNVDSNTLETPFDDLKRIPSDVVINAYLMHIFFFKALCQIALSSTLDHLQ